MIWTTYDIGLMLFFTSCYLFTGLSVCLASQVGLLNVGAEGQLHVAAIAVALVGLSPLPAPLSYAVAIIVAILAGAIWTLPAAWIKTLRGGSEVLATIMLNFIALALCQWLTVSKFPDPGSQNPQTPMVREEFLLRPHDPFVLWFDDSPASLFCGVAVILALILFIWQRRSTVALQLRAIAQNPVAAHTSGIPVARLQMATLAASGALAAGVGLTEVIGAQSQYRLGFSADYGFTGIAVALIARGNFLSCVPVALFFGFLQKAAQDLELETSWITRDMSVLIQGLMILAVVLWKNRGADGRN